MDIYRQPGRKPKGCLHKNWTRRQSSLWAGVERRERIHASCSASQQHPSVWAPLKASTTSGSCTNHPFWGNLHNNRVFLEKQFKDKWFPPLKSLVCSKTLHDFWSTCTWEGGKRERGSGYMKVVRIFFFFFWKREVGALCINLRRRLELLQRMLFSLENLIHKKIDTSVRDSIFFLKNIIFQMLPLHLLSLRGCTHA